MNLTSNQLTETPETKVLPKKKAINHEQCVINRRIGSTSYTVSIHISGTAKEDMNTVILRMIKNETEASI